MFEIYAAVRTTGTKKACHLSVLSIVKEYYLFKSLLNDAAMVWRNLLTKSHQVFRIYIIHHPFCNYYDIYISKTKQKKLQHNVFQFILPFFSTTYFVLYLVWYVYDNTYNLIVAYSQFIITFFSLLFQELIFKIWDWFSGELKLAPPSRSIHIWIFFFLSFLHNKVDSPLPSIPHTTASWGASIFCHRW